MTTLIGDQASTTIGEVDDQAILNSPPTVYQLELRSTCVCVIIKVSSLSIGQFFFCTPVMFLGPSVCVALSNASGFVRCKLSV